MPCAGGCKAAFATQPLGLRGRPPRSRSALCLTVPPPEDGEEAIWTPPPPRMLACAAGHPSPLPTRCGADPSFSGAVIVTSEPATGERPIRSVGKQSFPPSLAYADVVWTCLKSIIYAVCPCSVRVVTSASSPGTAYAFAACDRSIPAQFGLSVRVRSRVLFVQRPRSCAAGERTDSRYSREAAKVHPSRNAQQGNNL